MGDSGEFWRDVKPVLKAERRQQRNERERAHLEELVRLSRAGEIEYTILSPYQYRAWRPESPDVTADFYPRSGAIVVRGERRRGNGIGALLKALTPAGER